MRRIQFIEIHEQPWLPSFLRDEITDALQFGLNLFQAYAPIVPRLQRALDLTDGRSMIDLCSGGGGPWADLCGKLHAKNGKLQIWLTDKYPNHGAGQNVGTDCKNHLRFYPDAVDATSVPPELMGFRTMFTSFHHFSPDEAHSILQNAVDAREGIGIFEITRRAPSTMGLMFAWVIVVFALTPWIRPFRWSRLLWTYLVPIIPLIMFFDGVVSCLRTYRPKELRQIVNGLNAPEYRWEIEELFGGRAPITYLIGLPPGLPDNVLEN